MAKPKQWWVSKRDMTLAGQKVSKGQLIRPSGAAHDSIIFGDNTRWAFRLDEDVTTPLLCDTDGCPCRFADDGTLNRHRVLVHAPERDARERAKIEAIQRAADRELQADGDVIPGETTIGGHVVSQVKKGPRGPVPYLEHPMMA